MKLLFWPFIAIWRLITFLFCLMGRLITAIVGIIFTIIGLIVTITVVGAVIGIPIMLLGILLLTRALF